jgi:hypothetical protein
MSARVFLFFALLLALASNAQSIQHDDEHPIKMPGAPLKAVPAPTPWFTGAQLLHQLDPPTSAPNRQATVNEAVKYLMGVFDATESGLWCYTDHRPRPTPKQSPEVMRAKAVAHLRKQSRKRLEEKAAVLIVDMWQYDWPCPPDGCCPGRGY